MTAAHKKIYESSSVPWIHALCVMLACSLSALPAQVLVGKRMLDDGQIKVYADIFPLAMGFAQKEDIAYWHGMDVGVNLSSNTQYVSVMYGAAFASFNSASAFIGPLFDIPNRSVGMAVDITYYVLAIPVKLSLQNIASAQTGDMLFAASLCAGIGFPYPLIRLEKGRFKGFYQR